MVIKVKSVILKEIVDSEDEKGEIIDSCEYYNSEFYSDIRINYRHQDADKYS